MDKSLIDIRPFIKRCLEDKEVWISGGCMDVKTEQFYINKYGMTEDQVDRFWKAICILHGLDYELKKRDVERRYEETCRETEELLKRLGKDD